MQLFVPTNTQQAALSLLQNNTVAAPTPDTILIGFSSRCDEQSHSGETWRGWLFSVSVMNGGVPGSWQAIPMTVGNSQNDETGVTGGDHDRAAAVFTGAAPKKTTGSDIHCGTSIDQMIAQQYGQETLLPSMQLRSQPDFCCRSCAVKAN